MNDLTDEQKVELISKLATLDANTQAKERFNVFETVRILLEAQPLPPTIDDKVVFLVRQAMTDSENKDDLLAQSALKTIGRVFSRKPFNKHWSPTIVAELCDLLRRVLMSSLKKANVTIAAWIVSQQNIWGQDVTPQRPLPEVRRQHVCSSRREFVCQQKLVFASGSAVACLQRAFLFAVLCRNCLPQWPSNLRHRAYRH